MTKEDYFKYYIQGSDHYLIPKYEFIELFNEMENWKEESKKQKEVIDKAMEYINKNLILVSILDGVKTFGLNSYTFDYKELLEILTGEDKEVSE